MERDEKWAAARVALDGASEAIELPDFEEALAYASEATRILRELAAKGDE